MKRLFGILLALTMVLTLLPMGAVGAWTDSFNAANEFCETGMDARQMSELWFADDPYVVTARAQEEDPLSSAIYSYFVLREADFYNEANIPYTLTQKQSAANERLSPSAVSTARTI